MDPLEMARQLTLLDFDHFRQVKPYECTDQIWGDKRSKEAAASGGGRKMQSTELTGIAQMIRHTNCLTMWIATSIVRGETLKERTAALKFFAQFALHCRELNNFNGITAINAGLSMAPVHRLHKTWEAFAEKYPKIHEAYEEVAALVSPKGQYANYRKVLKDLVPPAIPFLGVYLTDLTFIELGNPDFLPDSHFINFEKRRKVHVVIRAIQSFQRTPYNLTPLEGAQEYFRSLESAAGKGMSMGWTEQPLLTEDELYDLSLVVEPREESDDEEEGDG
ncbi:hypothetical protein HK104_000484 [Borealophlyctis nickersoniae]|nr:hypothetical protein HK104_000484 [Borealophlyctis nickersoniae]